MGNRYCVPGILLPKTSHSLLNFSHKPSDFSLPEGREREYNNRCKRSIYGGRVNQWPKS